MKLANCDWCTWYNHRRSDTGIRGLGYKRGQVETFQTTGLVRLAKILRRVLETRGDLQSLRFQWKKHQITLTWKTLKRGVIIAIIFWQSWIITASKCTNYQMNFIEKTTKTWRVELTAGEKSLAEAKILRGIFYGNKIMHYHHYYL